MPRVTYTDYQGNMTTVEASDGNSVMETAVRNDVPGIVGVCGGFMSCATCHVYLDQDDEKKVAPVSEMEDEMLEGTSEERTAESRLSCQLRVRADIALHVTTPETQS